METYILYVTSQWQIKLNGNRCWSRMFWVLEILYRCDHSIEIKYWSFLKVLQCIFFLVKNISVFTLAYNLMGSPTQLFTIFNLRSSPPNNTDETNAQIMWFVAVRFFFCKFRHFRSHGLICELRVKPDHGAILYMLSFDYTLNYVFKTLL